jgi:acyl-CoA thioesterase I
MRTKLPLLSRRAILVRIIAAVFLLIPGFLLADAPVPQPVRVACVGDSITYGVGIKDRKNDSYPVCLGRWLGSGYDVRNFGRSGATLLAKGDLPYIKQKQYTDALAFKADIVVIILGTNDSKHPGAGSAATNNFANNWQYKADYVPDYEALIKAFREANPAAKIWVCCPPPSFPGQWGINDETIRDEIVPLVYQVAAQTGVKVINLYSALSGQKEMFPDTVHPNAVGAKFMAGVIYKGIIGKSPPAMTP